MPYPVLWALPTIAPNKDGRLEVAFLTSFELVHAWQTAPNGDQWRHESLGMLPTRGQLVQTQPGLAQNKDGRLEAFVVAEPRESGGMTALWHRWQQAHGGWSDWASLGAPDQVGLDTDDRGRALAVAQNRDGRLEVFVRGGDTAVWHIWQHAQGGWSDWASLGIPNHSRVWWPAVAPNRDGRLEVFMLGTDKGVWHIWQQAQGGWSDWDSLKGQLDASLLALAVGAHADGRLVIFAVGNLTDSQEAANTIWQREQAVAGGWSPWRSFSCPEGPQLSNPMLALDAHGQLQLWLQALGAELYRLKQTEPNGSEWNSSSWHFASPETAPSYVPEPAGGPPD